MGEVWKPIPSLHNRYEASDMGRIRSVCRKTPRIITPHPDRQGYLRVVLRGVEIKTSFNRQVHRLVYEAFNGTILEGMQVNHINEDKTDNRPCNLNLMTPKENTNWGTGIQRRSEKQKHDRRSKPIQQIGDNGRVIETFSSLNEAAHRTGYGIANLLVACKTGGKRYGFRWKRLST